MNYIAIRRNEEDPFFQVTDLIDGESASVIQDILFKAMDHFGVESEIAVMHVLSKDGGVSNVA